MSFRKEAAYAPEPELYSDSWERDASYTNWRPKGSGDYLLIHTEAGAGRFVTAEGTFIAQKGDVVLYAPGDMQDYNTDPKRKSWKLSWAHFTPKPHWQIWLNWPVNDLGLKVVHLGNGEVSRHFKRALHEVASLSRLPIPEAMDLAANSLEAALLWARTTVSQQGWYEIDARVRKAIAYLTNHLHEPFSMSRLARHCNVSESRLAHLFKMETKSSPGHFFETQRLRQACSLLRFTDRSIAEIAADIGYADPFYFTNRFRRHLGESPSAFRKHLQKAEAAA